MKRPLTAITLYSSRFDNGAKDVVVPVGEADYWANKFMYLAGVELVSLPYVDKPDLPYLGHVALNDRLAREWLIDQHVRPPQ